MMDPPVSGWMLDFSIKDRNKVTRLCEKTVLCIAREAQALFTVNEVVPALEIRPVLPKLQRPKRKVRSNSSRIPLQLLIQPSLEPPRLLDQATRRRRCRLCVWAYQDLSPIRIYREHQVRVQLAGLTAPILRWTELPISRWIWIVGGEAGNLQRVVFNNIPCLWDPSPFTEIRELGLTNGIQLQSMEAIIFPRHSSNLGTLCLINVKARFAELIEPTGLVRLWLSLDTPACSKLHLIPPLLPDSFRGLNAVEVRVDIVDKYLQLPLEMMIPPEPQAW
ncbi:hypothetical protein FS837_000128 [Tulasnella sp. UAMH 9824]|nr:hypothetical protein FS837_000128 [Tulasnella sp. UAMH 9824]